MLEAPMGLGKTEAALYAGYRLLESGKARGIYFALPTQLTSNRIFYRFNAFLGKILSSPHSITPYCCMEMPLTRDRIGEEGRPGGLGSIMQSGAFWLHLPWALLIKLLWRR